MSSSSKTNPTISSTTPLHSLSKEKQTHSIHEEKTSQINQQFQTNEDPNRQDPKVSDEKPQQSNDSNYRLYRFWIFFCIFVISVILIPHNLHNLHFGSHLFLALTTIIITAWIYTQYIIELYAIYLKNLSAASLALQMMGFNAFFLILATLYLGYNLVQYRLNPHVPPSDSSSTSLALLTVGLVVFSAVSVTHIFVTFWGALKVRDHLIQRQVAIEKAKTT